MVCIWCYFLLCSATALLQLTHTLLVRCTALLCCVGHSCSVGSRACVCHFCLCGCVWVCAGVGVYVHVGVGVSVCMCVVCNPVLGTNGAGLKCIHSCYPMWFVFL